MLQHLTFNLDSTQVRSDQLMGRDCWVVPMVMMTEGVANGSNGPLLYPGHELKEYADMWNNQPVVLAHPVENGRGITARQPDVINGSQLGTVLNNHVPSSGKPRWRSEAWLYKDRVADLAPEVETSILNKEPVEVSTGLNLDIMVENGEFDGKEYTGRTTNYRPDHLAILVDEKGACSVEQGAGLLMNSSSEGPWPLTSNAEMSHDDIRKVLLGLLQDKYPSNGEDYNLWTEDIYAEHLVYYQDGKLYKQSYNTAENGGIELSGDPVEVRRVTEYRTVAGGQLVGNFRYSGDSTMTKQKLIDAVVANAGNPFTSADAGQLNNFSVAQLESLFTANGETKPQGDKPAEEESKTQEADEVKTVKKVDSGDPVAQPMAVPEGNAPAATTQEAPQAAAAPAPQAQPAVANATAQPQKLDTYLASAPPEVAQLINNALAAERKQKEQLIATITANAANQFTSEFLMTKSTDELTGLAQLASAGQVNNAAPQEPATIPMFVGNAGGQAVANASAEEGMAITTLADLAAPKQA